MKEEGEETNKQTNNPSIILFGCVLINIVYNTDLLGQ